MQPTIFHDKESFTLNITFAASGALWQCHAWWLLQRTFWELELAALQGMMATPKQRKDRRP